MTQLRVNAASCHSLLSRHNPTITLAEFAIARLSQRSLNLHRAPKAALLLLSIMAVYSPATPCARQRLPAATGSTTLVPAPATYLPEAGRPLSASHLRRCRRRLVVQVPRPLYGLSYGQ